jgi:hypothetical protein
MATVPRTVTTDASGFALFDVVYAKEFTWVVVDLEARTVVAGSEGLALARFVLSGAAADFTNCLVPPPGQVSPYGIATTCACDERTNAICPTLSAGGNIRITANAGTTLPNGGGTFTFGVTGGTQTSYVLTASAGLLNPAIVNFGQSFTLTTTATQNGTTITLTATDLVTGQNGTLTLTQQ